MQSPSFFDSLQPHSFFTAHMPGNGGAYVVCESYSSPNFSILFIQPNTRFRLEEIICHSVFEQRVSLQRLLLP